MITELLLSLPVVYIVYKALYPFYLSPLAALPGPRSLPLIGNSLTLLTHNIGLPQLEWMRLYGPVYRFFRLFNDERVFLGDPVLIQHVLGKNAYAYTKPPLVQRLLRMLTGNGLIVAEGADHRRQRKYLQNIFTYKYVRTQAPMIAAHARQLVNKWKHLAKEGAVQLVVDSDLTRTTLDIIGKLAFGYDFCAMEQGEASPLYQAYETIFERPRTLSTLLGFTVPWTQRFIPYYRRVATAEQLVDATVRHVICTKQEEILSTGKAGSDLLSCLLKETMAEGLDISEDELKSQVLTWAVAGHETTAVAVIWTLHLLSQHPDVQSKLRDEINAQGLNDLSADDLNKLDYLSVVVKESLRLHPPMPTILRMATQDDTLPNGLFVPKGTVLAMYISTMHRLESVWGADAAEFKPERWETLSDMPNFTYTYMPFLCGPRACIGQKLALLELKMLLVHLIADLEFTPVQGFVWSQRVGGTVRPHPHMQLTVRVV